MLESEFSELQKQLSSIADPLERALILEKMYAAANKAKDLSTDKRTKVIEIDRKRAAS